MNEKVESLTTKEIGERLKLVRQGLQLTQSEVGKSIGSGQIAISKIENGQSVLSPVFLRLLVFYSQSISIDALFSENLNFVTHENLFDKSFAFSKIIKEKLSLLRVSTAHSLQQMNDEVLKNIDNTIDLL